MTTIFQRSEDGLSWGPDLSGETAHSLHSLFVGASLAAFEYWSEFILKIQRDNSKQSADIFRYWAGVKIPPMFSLRLRNSWWIGEQMKWDSLVTSFQIKTPAEIPKEATLQASTLVQMLSSSIDDLTISDRGDLKLTFSGNVPLHVVGAGGQWEESWILELPVDDPDREKWSVVCDSSGVVYAKWPSAHDAGGSTSPRF